MSQLEQEYISFLKMYCTSDFLSQFYDLDFSTQESLKLKLRVIVKQPESAQKLNKQFFMKAITLADTLEQYSIAYSIKITSGKKEFDKFQLIQPHISTKAKHADDKRIPKF